MIQLDELIECIETDLTAEEQAEFILVLEGILAEKSEYLTDEYTSYSEVLYQGHATEKSIDTSKCQIIITADTEEIDRWSEMIKNMAFLYYKDKVLLNPTINPNETLLILLTPRLNYQRAKSIGYTGNRNKVMQIVEQNEMCLRIAKLSALFVQDLYVALTVSD